MFTQLEVEQGNKPQAGGSYIKLGAHLSTKLNQTAHAHLGELQ